MQTFSARQENRATIIQAYELSEYVNKGYDVYQEKPVEQLIARAYHPEEIAGIELENNAHTMKIGG